jgi:ABC-type nickel/cobalt efflux system permease component RcnA
VSRVSESDEDALLPVGIGTAVWAVVLVILVLARSTLEATGTTWWIGAAVVGVVSGLGGLLFLRWRKGRARTRVDGS